MEFITLKVTCGPALIDVLIAKLFEAGFDSFREFDDGFEGSCEQGQFDKEKVEIIFNNFPNVTFTIQEQEKVNWNEEWEKNYDPIVVEDKCIVRASFHQARPEFDHEIIVTPKMSFGTGHHATTYQVLAYQMELDHKGKKVLDVGTGTGILAIMAAKRGAKELVATDIDDWCIENSEENFTLNSVNDVTLIKGEIDEVKQANFDIIIANINKNVLLDQIGDYAGKLNQKGQLILSGFYEDDMADLISEAGNYGLQKTHSSVRNRWAMLALEKRSV